MPCAAIAPIGSSMRTRSTASTPKTTIAPATKPITIAAHGATNAHAAVMATSARHCAVQRHRRSGFFDRQPRGEEPAPGHPLRPRGWCRARRRRRSPAPPKSTAERRPGLKPNQPNQRIDHASVTNAMLWPGSHRLPIHRELADPRPGGARPLGPQGRPGSDDHRAAKSCIPWENSHRRGSRSMRGDGVDEREDEAPRRVDPRLRPSAIAPRRSQQTARNTTSNRYDHSRRDRTEPRKGASRDGQEVVDRRHEAEPPTSRYPRRRRRCRTPTAK